MTPLSRLDPETGGSSWFRGAATVSECVCVCVCVCGIKKTDGVIYLMCDLESEGDRKCEKGTEIRG